ncbi:molybdopterin-guanine dinucleotide biosynthesis protein A [Stanieria sp. NIES-3757]|nr:molybdopterin-guanine dinucleotide biosynthesis protein A [Stanieria sp. NIES-3757]
MREDLIQTTTAIVLAGGQSSRMGKDKALLTISNSSLLNQICTLAQQCASQVYIVTPWIDKYKDIVPTGCTLIQETLLLPNHGSNSPLIGFAQGLQQVEQEWVLLLACDLPRLTSTEVKHWYNYLPEIPDNAIALLPRHPSGWWEPLAGFYRRSCLSLLEAYIAQGGKSFQGFLNQHFVAQLPINNWQILFNCNTPEELEIIKLELQ